MLSDFVVDQTQAVKFALDIANGMAFLHTLEPMIPRHYLNSKSVMVRRRKLWIRDVWYSFLRRLSQLCLPFSQIDEDMTARISMADVKFSFQCPGRMYSPAWVAPEGRHQSYSTDPKWQLKPHKLALEWWMQETLDCLWAKCNLQLISPGDRLKSKLARNINWLQNVKITREHLQQRSKQKQRVGDGIKGIYHHQLHRNNMYVCCDMQGSVSCV